MTLLAEAPYRVAFQDVSRARWTTRRREIVASYVDEKLSPRPRNRSLEYAITQFPTIAGLNEACASRLKNFLRQILRDDTAYATIIKDDDDFISAQWRSGLSYIAIEVSPSENSFVYADSSGELMVNRAGKDAFIPGEAIQILQQFTDDLNAANPNWRNYFN